MLFSEIYGAYYAAVSRILAEAVRGELTPAKLECIVREDAFAESALSIPAALRDGSWPLLDGDLRTPLRSEPTMPLTLLEKRWLKALLADPRARLFDVDDAGLEGVEPLYPPECFHGFDCCADGDPYGDAGYVARFRTVLAALREGRKLRLRYRKRLGREQWLECVPLHLEYSPKDDKFRLHVAAHGRRSTLNLALLLACEPGEAATEGERQPPATERRTLTLELIDERNTLERAMLHFSDLEKETRRLDEGRYRLTLRYDRADEGEMVIRVLSFGPTLRILEPAHLAERLRERLRRQRMLTPGFPTEVPDPACAERSDRPT